MEEFDDASRGATSFVPAVMTAGLFFAMGFQGQILRRFKIPHIVRAGTLINSVGPFLSALATQLWQLYFTLALLGIGGGIALPNGSLCVMSWWVKRRTFAMALSGSGNALRALFFFRDRSLSSHIGARLPE